MKRALLFLFMFGTSAWAQYQSEAPRRTSAVIRMNGDLFCRMLAYPMLSVCGMQLPLDRVVNLNLSDIETTATRPWSLQLYFGNASSVYKPTNMDIRTSRLNVRVQNVAGRERASTEYFQFWRNNFENPFQWVDEPNNNLKVVFDRHQHQFFLVLNHPKMVYANGHSEPDLNQHVRVDGTLDGSPIHDEISFKRLGILRYENSLNFVQVEAGYGYAIPLVRTERFGRIYLTPQFEVGSYFGPNNAAMLKRGELWEADSYRKGPVHAMGASLTGAARLEWQGNRKWLGVFAEYRNSYAKLKYPFLDGTASHDLRYQSITFGISGIIRGRRR